MSTINVPGDFPTISAAITAAVAADTIVVAQGVYNEQVNINKTLTLNGPQVNVDARTRPFLATDEAIITIVPAFGSGIINLLAQDIIINGFTIQEPAVITNGTAGIFAGDIGIYPPTTGTLNVTGISI